MMSTKNSGPSPPGGFFSIKILILREEAEPL